jgi:hypothetical protein
MASDNEFMGPAAEIAALVKKKNEDYGGSYYKLRDKYGPTSFLIRLADKTGRLDELLSGKGKKPVSGETTEDTIKDVMGYCLLELQYRKNEKMPAGTGRKARSAARTKPEPEAQKKLPAAEEKKEQQEATA